MSINSPGTPGAGNPQHGLGGTGDVGGDTHEFGDLQVSTGSQSAYITIELILYLLTALGIFITAAVIDENGSGQGFGASEAWFYVTLLTVGFMISRGLSKMAGRNGSRAF